MHVYLGALRPMNGFAHLGAPRHAGLGGGEGPRRINRPSGNQPLTDFSEFSQMRTELEQIREWANAKIASGQEPPWAWFQYMKLRETLDSILAGMDSVTTENSQQSVPHQGTHLRLVAETDPQDSASHRPVGLPVQLPT